MAVLFGTMSTPGEEIRRTRVGRGLSQAELARLAGVSTRTIGRIESGTDYDDPRTIPLVQRALGIGGHEDDGPPLRRASASEFAAELVRRLTEAERILEHARIRSGEVPPEAKNNPNLIRGPRVKGQSGDRAQTDG